MSAARLECPELLLMPFGVKYAFSCEIAASEGRRFASKGQLAHEAPLIRREEVGNTGGGQKQEPLAFSRVLSPSEALIQAEPCSSGPDADHADAQGRLDVFERSPLGFCF